MSNQTHEPLVRLVSALPGTRAHDLLAEIARLDKSISTCSGDKVGLFLVDDPQSKTFSLKYKASADGLLEIPIGVHLPKNRNLHVAQSIVAMIKRGRGWKNGKDVLFEEAYGEKCRPHARRERRPRESGRNRRYMFC